MTYIQSCSHETDAWPVYEANWVLFKVVWCSIKMLLCPCILEGSRPLVRSFKWHTAWSFTYRRIRITRSQIKKFQKSMIILSKVVTLNLWFVVVLMPLEIKHHKVPHLKDLNIGLYPKLGMGVAANLHLITPLWKGPISLYKQAKQQVHMNVAVGYLKCELKS